MEEEFQDCSDRRAYNHKVNRFNRGHFLLFILAVNLFVNFQKWWAPRAPMNIHDSRGGETQERDLI